MQRWKSVFYYLNKTKLSEFILSQTIAPTRQKETSVFVLSEQSTENANERRSRYFEDQNLILVKPKLDKCLFRWSIQFTQIWHLNNQQQNLGLQMKPTWPSVRNVLSDVGSLFQREKQLNSDE